MDTPETTWADLDAVNVADGHYARYPQAVADARQAFNEAGALYVSIVDECEAGRLSWDFVPEAYMVYILISERLTEICRLWYANELAEQRLTKLCKGE